MADITRPKKILVSVSGSKADEEAVELACLLAHKQKARIFVVYVVEVKHSLPLDAEIASEAEKAEKILTRAEEIAEQQDYAVETDVVQAREVGPAIVDEAMDMKADLLIMGIGYKKRFGQFSLGTAVPYVLKEAPCPVLVYREPIFGGES